MKEGDRVRLKADKKATGTIDELWASHEVPGGQPMATVVWDRSGCCGDGPEADLELLPKEEDDDF